MVKHNQLQIFMICQSWVFFNLWHIFTCLISEFDFLEVDKHQWMEQAESVILRWTCHKLCSQSIRLEYSLILNISWLNWFLTSIFWMQLDISRRKSKLLNRIYQMSFRLFFFLVFQAGTLLALLLFKVFRLCDVTYVTCRLHSNMEFFVFWYWKSIESLVH